MIGQDIGRVDEEIRPVEIALGIAGQLGQIFLDLPPLRPPREVRVGLGEAELGEPLHQLRSRKRFGQEDHVRVAKLNLVDEPLPEPEGFGVGVVDPEDLHALVDPEQDHVAQRIPQRARVLGGEVGVDDVLVFLRRVLGIAHRAVRPALEPLRMLLEPGVIGRALHGEVERDFHAVLVACRDQGAEILERAEFRMHGVMAALDATDRIGTAGIAFAGGHRVVAALAIDFSDRMDRREVEHVEAHGGDIGQPGDAIHERAVLAGNLALAARHHFIPGAKARLRPVSHERKQLRPGEVGPQLTLRHRRLEVAAEQRCRIAGLQVILAMFHG